MKSKLLSILLILVMLASLAACTNSTSGNTPGDTPNATDEQTTEIVTTENTTDPKAGLALNEDVLSDFGLTFSELLKKRGEKTDAYVDGGGIGYFLEDGYGSYAWAYDDIDFGRELTRDEEIPIPKDEDGDIIIEKVPLPKQDIPCEYIGYIDAEDFFLNASFPFDITDMESIEGAKDFSYGQEPTDENGDIYYSSFSHNELRILIRHTDKDKIDSDTGITIRNIEDVY